MAPEETRNADATRNNTNNGFIVIEVILIFRLPLQSRCDQEEQDDRDE